MKLLIDMDEVLAQWGARVLEWYNADKLKEAQAAGHVYRPWTIDDIRNWDVKTDLGPGSEVYLRNYMRYPNFYQDLDPVPGAVDGMRQLLDWGHDVKIVTAIPKCAGLAYEGKLQWLRRHMPFFPLNKFYTTHEKQEVKGDLLLDDGMHNLGPFRAAGGVAVAFSRPWNAGWNGFRVDSWTEFLDLVDWGLG